MVGIEYPIIQAGMGPYSTNDLSIAVANAGALGIISGVGMGAMISRGVVPEEALKVFGEGTPYQIMRRTIENVKENTRQKGGIFGINCPVSQEFIQAARQLIPAALDARKEDSDIERRLRVIITSAGNPKPWAEPIKKSGAIWAHVVPSVYHAKKAESAGADLIIASGHEGGAHISWEPVHTMVLLPEVVKAVKTPVVGAGGFCDGATLAAALALGAIGIQMGTRFIATKESDFVQMWKDFILQIDERSTLVARGLFGPMRFIKSDASMRIGEATIRKLPRMFLNEPVGLDSEVAKIELEGFKGLFTKDPEKAVMLAGEVAGRIKDLPSVEELIQKIMKEAEDIIKELPEKFLK
jgi:NAD(P)H-dependent flavin oxidoreductase YrpB (nitropropane dioxygenase family)